MRGAASSRSAPSACRTPAAVLPPSWNAQLGAGASTRRGSSERAPRTPSPGPARSWTSEIERRVDRAVERPSPGSGPGRLGVHRPDERPVREPDVGQLLVADARRGSGRGRWTTASVDRYGDRSGRCAPRRRRRTRGPARRAPRARRRRRVTGRCPRRGRGCRCSGRRCSSSRHAGRTRRCRTARGAPWGRSAARRARTRRPSRRGRPG